jgi:hypothetical protein
MNSNISNLQTSAESTNIQNNSLEVTYDADSPRNLSDVSAELGSRIEYCTHMRRPNSLSRVASPEEIQSFGDFWRRLIRKIEQQFGTQRGSDRVRIAMNKEFWMRLTNLVQEEYTDSSTQCEKEIEERQYSCGHGKRDSTTRDYARTQDSLESQECLTESLNDKQSATYDSYGTIKRDIYLKCQSNEENFPEYDSSETTRGNTRRYSEKSTQEESTCDYDTIISKFYPSDESLMKHYDCDGCGSPLPRCGIGMGPNGEETWREYIDRKKREFEGT